jgi:hypothetical protein
MLTEPFSEPIYQDVQPSVPAILTKQEENKPAPVRKRRVHWIIPTAIAIIAILCVVFYFRTFYPFDGRQSAVDGQQSPVAGQQSAVGSQQSIVDSLGSIVDSQPNEKLNPEPETRNPEPTPNTQPPKSILRSVEGRHLFRMAREEYGNPFLWVLIYRANLDKIPDPDMVVSGREIIIPALEGTPEKLSRNDSLAVSDGYRLVYEYYQSKGDPRANDFFKGIDRYKPK